MDVSIYSPINSARGFPILNTLSIIYCFKIFFLNDGYSDQCGVILHCSFDLYLSKRWEYQTTLPVSWETRVQAKKQQLEPDTEQWTGSKLGKEYVKAVYYHPAYLIYMQSISCEMPGWMNQKLESRLPGETSITSDMPFFGRKWRRTKEPLDESERG